MPLPLPLAVLLGAGPLGGRPNRPAKDERRRSVGGGERGGEFVSDMAGLADAERGRGAVWRRG